MLLHSGVSEVWEGSIQLMHRKASGGTRLKLMDQFQNSQLVCMVFDSTIRRRGKARTQDSNSKQVPKHPQLHKSTLDLSQYPRNHTNNE